MHDSLNVLTALTQDMLEAGDCETRLQLVTDFALRLSPAANQASVRLSCNDTPLAARSSGGAGASNTGRRISRPRSSWVAEKPRNLSRPKARRGAGSSVEVPIQARGTTLGVLSLSSESRNAFSDRDQLLARLLAQAAAQALITSELEQRVITDAQTLAFNRGYLFPCLDREMKQARSHSAALSVLLMDIDHFKRINDEHGHPTGDAVLRSFADRVRSLVRTSDVLVRRGGEEFVLILPRTNERCALIAAERIRTQVAASPILMDGPMSIGATISIGVAAWDGVESGESLDARADSVLYEAKQLGRNRSICYGSRRTLQLCSGHG
ncbi:MAG TPA: GGDEF domain-containing protein [Polyangiales bacterium]|nr:GGDEF domain-containing protein [Polyangiales bacterium]